MIHGQKLYTEKAEMSSVVSMYCTWTHRPLSWQQAFTREETKQRRNGYPERKNTKLLKELKGRERGADFHSVRDVKQQALDVFQWRKFYLFRTPDYLIQNAWRQRTRPGPKCSCGPCANSWQLEPVRWNLATQANSISFTWGILNTFRDDL